MPVTEPTPVERAAKHVEHVKASLKRVIDWKPFNGKPKAIAAIRRELVEAEKANEAAKNSETAAKAAPAQSAAETPVKQAAASK